MNNRRLNELDLLRFLAAFAVVIFHYAFRGYARGDMSVMPYPMLADVAKYGYLGVELFFMISGFVILMTASSNDLKAFFISRVIRLCPAFWVCCTITFLVTLAIGQPRFSADLYQYVINLTFLGDVIGVPPIDGVYWSLFVEIKFYFMIAILLAFKKIEKIETFLVLWLLISAAAEVFAFEKLRSVLITDYAAYFIAGDVLHHLGQGFYQVPYFPVGRCAGIGQLQRDQVGRIDRTEIFDRIRFVDHLRCHCPVFHDVSFYLDA